MLVIIDGNHDFHLRKTLGIQTQNIIEGDKKVPQISMASILAKVARDREMIMYHDAYPHYGFDRHKGYGTQYHRQMVSQYGPCAIHRKTFLSRWISEKT